MCFEFWIFTPYLCTFSFWTLQHGNRTNLWHYDDYKNVKNLGRLWTCSGFSCQIFSCQFLVVVCTCLFICIFHIYLLYKFDTFVCVYTSKFCLISKINVFWDMLSCSLVQRYQHFVILCRHLWRKGHHVPIYQVTWYHRPENHHFEMQCLEKATFICLPSVVILFIFCSHFK